MPAKINLYDEEIKKLLQDRGNDVIWEQACICNCYNKDSGQPDFLCPVCKGSGFIYLEGKTIRVGVTSLTGNYTIDTLMLREPGTVYMTPQADIIMGYHDRITFKDFRCKFSEVLRIEKDNTTQATFRNIKDIIYIGDRKYEYEKDIDYTILPDTYHIQFNKPIEEAVSILYYTTPRYYVIDLLHELRAHITDRYLPKETFRELPKQYLLKRELWNYGININKEEK